MIKVGDKAPDFKLQDQNEEDVSLSDLKGKRVLISWHPLAWTSVCTDQMRALERNYDRLKEKGIEEVIGVSVDAQPGKAVWAKALGIKNVKLVADFEPKGEMSKAYDIWLDDMGASGRGNAIIDAEENIEWAKQYETKSLPDIEEVIENA